MDEKLLDELAKPCWSFDHMSFDHVSFARSVMHAQEQGTGECSTCKHAATVTVGPCVRCIDEVKIYRNYSPLTETE